MGHDIEAFAKIKIDDWVPKGTKSCGAFIEGEETISYIGFCSRVEAARDFYNLLDADHCYTKYSGDGTVRIYTKQFFEDLEICGFDDKHVDAVHRFVGDVLNYFNSSDAEKVFIKFE